MSHSVIDLLRGESTPLYLAPQAGVSESPFRRLCRRFGADVLVSEFVSAAGIVMNSKRSREYLRFDEVERPIGIQIFGADPAMMADASAFVAETFGPDFIDINFGCPVKKVVKRNGGSGCLRDLGLVDQIIRAVDDATELPTTVRVRSGFNESTRDPVAIGLACEQAGAKAICLHPRTRADMYSGQARWSEITAMVEALDASQGSAVDAMADRVRATWGAPSLVVNSAGAGIWRFLEETTPAEVDSMIGAPYLAAAQTSRAFIGKMIAAGRGLLIHVGSPASVIPWPGATAYTASRWALRGLHEALCQDLRGTGVRSSLIYFGEVSSDYFQANPGSHEHMPSLGSWIPMSSPERCAKIILHVVRRPRPVVYHPFALRLMAWTAALAPAPTRWLIARTGRRHELNR